MMKSVVVKLLFFIGLISIIASCVKEVKTEPDNSIKLTFESVTFPAGTTKQLVCQNYSASDLIWSSTDTTIVKVDAAGLLTAFKAGLATINVKSKAHAVSATCTVTVIDQAVSDVGVGADGSVFVIGTDSVSMTGGYGIYKLVDGRLIKLPACAGVRIAVDPHGMPWVVNKSHLIFRYNGTIVWDQMPGTATDIGIGANGSVYAIGTQNVSPTGGYNIMKWNGTGWDNMADCAGIHIAVAPDGTPWVVNKSNIVFRYGGTYLWDPLNGIAGNDIGIGANGSVYVTGKDSTLTGYQPPIYNFANNQWNTVSGISGGVSISVDPAGRPYYIDKSGELHKP
jgi:hypothetical protein